MNTQQIFQMGLDLVGLKSAPDSQIYHPGENIRRVLFGIDIGVPELLLARQLGYDAVIAHHMPAACLTFPEVLRMGADLLIAEGVPAVVAREAVAPTVEARVHADHSVNFDHVSSVARLLDMPYLNIHQPCDELGRRMMAARITERVGENGTLQDVVDAFMSFPEFQRSPIRPEIRIGRPGDKAGRVVFFHGAGTNGGYGCAHALYEVGVQTVAYIHIAQEAQRKLQAEGKGHLVISGHIPSDMVGINPLVKQLREAGLQVDGISGVDFYDINT